MKRTITLFTSTLFVLLLLSCEKETLDPVGAPAPAPLFATAEVFGSAIEGRLFFNFVAGEEVALDAASSSRVTWESEIRDSEEGPSLFTGAMSRESGADPLFGLQFWPEDLAAGEGLSQAAIDTYFVPGRVFEAGRGAGKVELYVRLPRETGVMENASRASYMLPYELNGDLEITGAEPYEYEVAPGRFIAGRRVTCWFSLFLVGHYDIRTAMDNGAPGLNWEDLNVKVRNGEAAFFVAYP